jgi:RNA polymerase sigma factor (sigma-70 family)
VSNQLLIDLWRKRWHWSLIQFLRRRVRLSVDIEDLAQETYMRLLRARDLGDVLNPQAYLLRVAGNIVIEWRERQPAQDTVSEMDENQLIDQFDLECDLDAKITQERLNQVLAHIPTVTRAVLLLRFRDGLTRKQISEALAITERQTRRHLIKGYEYLRESFTELKGVKLNEHK